MHDIHLFQPEKSALVEHRTEMSLHIKFQETEYYPELKCTYIVL